MLGRVTEATESVDQWKAGKEDSPKPNLVVVPAPRKRGVPADLLLADRCRRMWHTVELNELVQSGK